LNTALRDIFGPKSEELTGGWRKLCNEELHNLYCLSGTIRAIKSRKKFAGYITYREEINSYKILKYQKERVHFEDPAIDGRMILKWILENDV